MKGSDRLALALALVFLVSYALRVWPTLTSGVPYHTDSFPQIRNAQVLVAMSPVPLAPGNGFGPYNIFWPGATLFYSVASEVLGVSPTALLPLLAPLVSSLAVPLFFALSVSLGFDRKTSLLAALFFGTAGSLAVLTAGVTKEGFAVPLMVVFLLLMNEGLKRTRPSYFALGALSFVTLLSSHHLTSVVALLVSVYLGLAYALSPSRTTKGVLVLAGAVGVLTGASVLYFYVYALQAIPLVLQPSDVVAIVGYEAVFLLPVWFARSFRLSTGRWLLAWGGASAFGVFAFFAATLEAHPLLDSPLVPADVAVVALPYLLGAVLAVAGLYLARDREHRGLTFASAWIFGVFGIAGFAMFGTPGISGDVVRIGDLLFPAVAVLAAYALVRASSGASGASGKVAVALVAAVLVSGSMLVVPYTALLSGPLGGSQRLYSQSDVAAVSWAGSRSSAALYGDARFGYLSSEYSQRPVDIGWSFSFLAGIGGFGSGCLLLNGLAPEIGFIGYTYGLPLNNTVLTSISNSSHAIRVYADGDNVAYCSL